MNIYYICIQERLMPKLFDHGRTLKIFTLQGLPQEIVGWVELSRLNLVHGTILN